MSGDETISGKLIRFLNETDPAKLLIWCAVFLVLATICGVVRLQLQTGLSWSSSQQFMDSSQNSISIPSKFHEASGGSGLGAVRGITAFLLNIGTLVFGIIGGLLPMWAVGRLIADAIREGHKHE